MSSSAASDDILKRRSQSEQVWQRLAVEQWPVPLNLLPAETALVGGAVRDALLNRLPAQQDLDLVVKSDAVGLTQRLNRELGGSLVVLDETRDIARLVLRGWTIDIARQEGHNLEDDLWRRDYRLNAIALPLKTNRLLVDPTRGIEDLAEGRLRAVREANLSADPLRLLRGLRLLAQIPLTLDATTAHWIRSLRHRLKDAAPERILAEIRKLVAGPHADEALQQLTQLDLIRPWAAYQHLPAFDDAALLTSDERQEALPLARLSGLISDEGLRQLRASRSLQQRCRRLRYWLQTAGSRLEQLAEDDRLQLHLDLEADLPALILHLDRQIQDTWLNRWRDSDDPLFHPHFPLSGSTLMDVLAMPAGPLIGDLLTHLRKNAAFGRIKGQEQALREAQRWWAEAREAL